MKICGNCGNENTDAMNFCLQCGMPLASNPAWNAEEPTASFSGKPFESAPLNAEPKTIPRNFSMQPKKNGKGLYWIVGGIVTVLALGFFGIAGLVGMTFLTAKQTAPPPTPLKPVYSPSPLDSPLPDKSPAAVPTPQTSFTPPTAPTKKGIFTVSADQGWQLSNIDVTGSEKFLTSVGGKINLKNIKQNVSANGVSDAKTAARRLFPQYPTGALLMRTRFADGRVSNMQPVSANVWQNYPDEFGRLEFCVNDREPQSNDGEFVVIIVAEEAKAKK